MKGFKLKIDMDLVNTVLLVVILALVVYCLVKQNERFQNTDAATTNAAMNNVAAMNNASAMNNAGMNANAGMNSSVENHLRKIHKILHANGVNTNSGGNGANNGSITPMPTV